MQNKETKFIEDTVQLFKIYSDFTRLKIINLLSKGEFCVQTISKEVDASQSSTSHQLRLLRDRNVVKIRKDGKRVYYSLKDNHIKDIFLTAYKHITECD
ncbi:MAG: metalloregulator ArsR/SmtB family transcription factor [Candidatus Izimaplasma sp.]|nr:metalloregulator ArsR/SmtB family transcription factor [Candidatus Izimaplasma bacterium]